jgi:anti-anti-sigma factor
VGIPELVPLYACAHCGFTSAAFRAEAAHLHRLEYPECDGAIRIVFRSDDRYRGPTYSPGIMSQPVAARSTQEEQARTGEPERAFAIREGLDPDEALRLTLLGDLDVTSAQALSTRLAELKTTGRPVRLDLSRLGFIDSSGLQAVLLALTGARWDGWHLEVAPEVSKAVERAAQIVGIAQVLWPQDPAPGTERASQR